MVSSSPEGPFRTLDGKGITKTLGWRPFSIEVGHAIDAEVFPYEGFCHMVWSQHFIGRLKAGFDGSMVPITTKCAGNSESLHLFESSASLTGFCTLVGNDALLNLTDTNATGTA